MTRRIVIIEPNTIINSTVYGTTLEEVFIIIIISIDGVTMGTLISLSGEHSTLPCSPLS